MAAYGAVVSLVQMLHPDEFPVHHRNAQIEYLYRKVCSLQSSLEKIFPVPKSIRSSVNDLTIEIREAVYKAQDKIESFIFKQSEIHVNQSSTSTFLQELDEITTSIDPLAAKAEKIAGSMKKDPETQDYLLSENAQPSKSSSGVKRRKIVGQEKDLKNLKDKILNDTSQLQVVPVVGMPGIGKTTLANSIYDDSAIINSFGVRAWVTVSQEYQVGEIFSKLLLSMESKSQKAGERVIQGRVDQKLPDILHQSLFNTKYLIVVDDMWDINVWNKVKLSFPDNRNGSRIVLTTRDKQIANYAKSSDFIIEMQPLDPENSWKLLSYNVFGDGSCPTYLKDVGWKIAQNCHGLPLSLTVIGGLLRAQNKMTNDYWNSIEQDTNAAAATGDKSYLAILYLSYNHLPGRLKGCFLYMGAFPKDSEILVSILIKLWVAEGFLKPPSYPQTMEQVARDYLEQLIDRNLLNIRKITSDSNIKACGMHNTLRDLAVQECDKEKFFHLRKSYVQQLSQGTNTQRRVSVHKNILMCVEQVHESLKEITFARTLLYASVDYRPPLPFCLTFNLLRVLDAFTVYFIQFPSQISKLIHLRYLSFTYNGKLPSSLSNLKKLQTLIVRRNPKIIFVGKSFLPDEIWNMPQLRHLMFTESDFPSIIINHVHDDSLMFANLQSLSNVCASSCTKEVLENMPNLKKLGMWTDSPDAAVGLYLDQVQQLESFKFTVLNPKPMSMIEFHPKLDFPKTMKKLRLSGCSLPWEDMQVIGQLPCLEVLKLREVAFQGDEWCPKDNEFRKLKFLLMEYLNLKNWNANYSHFPMLERLMLSHCYELEGIPTEIGFIGCLELIELVDCSSYAVNSAEEIRDEQEVYDNKRLRVRVYSSLE